MGILGKVARQCLRCSTQDCCFGQSNKTKVYTVPQKVGVWGRVTRPPFTLYHTMWVCEAELLDQGLQCTTEGGCLEKNSMTKVYTIPLKVGVLGRVKIPQFTLYHTRWAS